MPTRWVSFLTMLLLIIIGCGDSHQAGKHFRQGVTYEQQGRQADAMREYQLAVECRDDSGYQVRAMDAIGHLYLEAGKREEALAQFRQSLLLATENRDTAMMVLSLRDMSRCFRGNSQENSSDSAIACFDQASRLISQAHLDSLSIQIWPEWLAATVEAGNLDAVAQLLDQQPRVSPSLSKDQGPLWLARGRTLLVIGQREEAEASLQQAAASPNIKTHAAAAMLLSQMEADDNQYEDAWLNAMECVAMLDSINSQTVAANKNHVELLTHQLEVERDNARLRLRLVLTGVAMLLAILCLTAFFRSKTRRLRLMAERYRQAQEAMHRNSEAYVAEAQRNIDNLTKEIEHAREQNDLLQTQLLSLTRQREERRLNEAREHRTQQESLMAAFRHTELHAAFDAVGQTGQGSISEEQWRQLELFADKNAERFAGRLMEYYPKMRPNDLRLCLLVKMGFTNLQISNIFHRTQQASTNARKRLFTRIFDKEGLADDLNRFILSF